MEQCELTTLPITRPLIYNKSSLANLYMKKKLSNVALLASMLLSFKLKIIEIVIGI